MALAGLPNSIRVFSHTQFGLSFIIITFNDVAIIDAPSCARAIEATPHAALVKLLVIRERETLFFALLKP